MGLPDITGDLFTSYEQLFYPFKILKTVNLIAANIPYDTCITGPVSTAPDASFLGTYLVHL